MGEKNVKATSREIARKNRGFGKSAVTMHRATGKWEGRSVVYVELLTHWAVQKSTT